MSKSALRILLTILLYAGVGIFLWPYFTGHISTGILYLIGGAGLTVVCGLLRCCLTEGDCSDRIPTKPFS
jgi:hypothetical protein